MQHGLALLQSETGRRDGRGVAQGIGDDLDLLQFVGSAIICAEGTLEGAGIRSFQFAEHKGGEIGMVVRVHDEKFSSGIWWLSRSRSFLMAWCMMKPTLPVVRPVISAISW